MQNSIISLTRFVSTTPRSLYLFSVRTAVNSGSLKLMIGGHTHVRDCVTFDDHSIG